MSRIIRWTCRSAYALFVAAALTFGTTQAFATTTLDDCPTGTEFIGTCPPFNDFSCDEACKNEGLDSGSCLGHCCVCRI